VQINKIDTVTLFFNANPILNPKPDPNPNPNVHAKNVKNN